MLKKLFGGKKKEFFVELDESAATKAEAKVDSVATETPETVAKKPETVSKSKQKSVKSKVKETQKVPSETASAVVASTPVKVEPTEVAFATKSFISNTSRRTPGPSLAKFKEMARQSKSVK